MRIIFFGTSEFAVPSLEHLLAARQHVVLCVTQPDRSQGRGLRTAHSPLKAAALRLRVPVVQPERLAGDLFNDVQADAGVVAAYGQLIPRGLLGRLPHGMLGVHPSLLPKYRGAAPIAWALLNGDPRTGVTIFRLNERMDAGDILSQRVVAIEPEEHAEAHTQRLAMLGAQGLVEALDAIAASGAIFKPQVESEATIAPKLTKAQGRIDWRRPAESIARLVRALVPWPGARTWWQGQDVKIWKASVEASPSGASSSSGSVVRVDPEGIAVATGQGLLRLEEVQLAGRRRMGAKEFLAGHRLHIGDILGGDT